MAWYKTGTITVTNGSTTVTGSGTQWIANAGVGEALYAPDGRLYEITNIASDTSITIAPAYLGSTASGQAYTFVPSQSYIRDLASQAADLVNNYSTIANNAGVGKFGDGTVTAPGIRFSDDLDTGFFRSASNEVTFVAGGVAQFKYNASGLSISSGTANVTNLAYTGTLTGGTGVVNIGSGQVYKDASGNLIVGTTATRSVGNGFQQVTSKQFFNELGATDLVGFTSVLNRNDSNALRLVLGKSRATAAGGVTAVQNGDNLATLLFAGADGTTLNSIAAEITASVDGTPGTNDMPGRLVFGTTADGASSPTERMRIDSSGNLQIGTNTSRGKLHSFASAFNPLNSTWATSASFTATGGFGGGLAFVDGSSGYGMWVQDSGGTFAIGQGSTSSALTERMRIDSSGNVGIGTSSPATKLNVIGDIQVSRSTSASDAAINFGSNSNNYIFAGNSSNLMTFATNGSERMRIDSSGNVGIGASLPEGRLQANASGDFSPAIIARSNTSATNWARVDWKNHNVAATGIIYLDQTGNFSIRNDGAAPILFLTNGSNERMRIDSSGNFLVGKTGTDTTNAGAYFEPSSIGYGRLNFIKSTASGTGGTVAAGFYYNGTIVGSISNTSTATSYVTSSDYRLKENVEPMTGALEKVAALKPCTYTWKSDGSDGQGFIAHELQEVVPDCVTGTKDAVDKDGKPQYQGVDTSFLIATLTAALQEQQALIQDLTTRLTTLEGK
jgi:hypothetical protein